MCKITENLVLCTCEDETPLPTIHHKKSKRWKEKHPELHQPLYVWVLSKYEGTYPYIEGAAQMIGLAKMPSKTLSEDITVELFLEELNKRYCFDFEYELNDGDSLEILKDGDHDTFFSFIYKNGKWQKGGYHGFGNEILTSIDGGKVKF